jgi:uncharacterized membrane protein
MNPNNSLRARLEAFADGVMAIAITLLAIELPIPHIQTSDFASGVTALAGHIPDMGAFVLSFVTIAIFWVNHHHLTQRIEPGGRISRRVVWGNMMFLMFVTLIPFATTVMTENSFHVVSTLVYAIVLFGASVSFTIVRSYIHHTSMTALSSARSLVGPILYALAILVLPVIPTFGYVLLAIPPVFYFLPRSTW